MCGARDESLLLDDLIEAASRLMELGAGVAPELLGDDLQRREGLLLNLIVLGEAAKRLLPDIRGRFGEVPWADMAETRERVVHHYEGIDWGVVADIIENDLPPLLKGLIRIRDILRAEADQG